MRFDGKWLDFGREWSSNVMGFLVGNGWDLMGNSSQMMGIGKLMGGDGERCGMGMLRVSFWEFHGE